MKRVLISICALAVAGAALGEALDSAYYIINQSSTANIGVMKGSSLKGFSIAQDPLGPQSSSTYTPPAGITPGSTISIGNIQNPNQNCRFAFTQEGAGGPYAPTSAVSSSPDNIHCGFKGKLMTVQVGS